MAALPGKRLTAAVAAAAGLALLAPAPAFAHSGGASTLSAWSAEPAVLAAAGLAFALFMQAWLRLRARGRGDYASAGRIATFLAGLALGVLPLVSPLDAIGEDDLLSAHMLQHVLIGDAAVALVVLSVRGPLVFFLLPPAILGPLARSPGARRAFGLLGDPWAALAVWCATIGVWHVPSLYDAVLRNRALHDLEHATFALAGLLVWNQLLDPARRERLSRSGRLALLVALFTLGQTLSTLLLFAGRPLYPAYAFQNALLPSVSPLTDQRLAGAVMMLEQTIALGALGASLLLTAEHEARALRQVGT